MIQDLTFSPLAQLGAEWLRLDEQAVRLPVLPERRTAQAACRRLVREQAGARIRCREDDVTAAVAFLVLASEAHAHEPWRIAVLERALDALRYGPAEEQGEEQDERRRAA